MANWLCKVGVPGALLEENLMTFQPLPCVYGNKATSYANGFLGDYVLMRYGFIKIRKELTSSTRYIVFVPVCEIKDGEKTFSYRIKLTGDEIFPKEMGILSTFALRDIGVQANPSPPQNFY
ncbi:MAG: hypothetical protein LH478_06940 [Chitinophagaceae bacterium]|nr:hypothetical protein [Chitinophagaceae bacterium]